MADSSNKLINNKLTESIDASIDTSIDELTQNIATINLNKLTLQTIFAKDIENI